MGIAEDEFINTLYVDEEVGHRVSPCIEILAVTGAALLDAPHAGWLNFYNAFRKRFGPQMKWYKTNTDSNFRKLTPAKLDMVPFWFEDKRSRSQTRLGVEIKPGDKPDDMQLPSFEFHFRSILVKAPVSVFHMALPLQHGFETLDGMLPLVKEALAEFPLLCGYVGYTVYWDTLDFRFDDAFFKQNMPRLYMRHPGIGLAEPRYIYPYSLEGLPGVSWLTLLGPEFLEKAGGMAHLQSQLPAPITVQPLDCQGGGALIAAGPRPLVGDLAVGDDLPLYKAVGKALRDVRFPGTFYGGGLDKSVSHQWFMRFFGEE